MKIIVKKLGKFTVSISPLALLVNVVTVWALIHTFECTKPFGGFFAVMNDQDAWHAHASPVDALAMMITLIMLAIAMIIVSAVIAAIVWLLQGPARRLWDSLTIKVTGK